MVFVSIRIFSGGYHANSYGKCFTLFAITCFLYLFMVQEILLYGGNQTVLFLAAVVFLGGMILKKAPIAHVNRPLSQKQYFTLGFLDCGWNDLMGHADQKSVCRFYKCIHRNSNLYACKRREERRALNFWLKWQKQQREQTEGFLNLVFFSSKNLK